MDNGSHDVGDQARTTIRPSARFHHAQSASVLRGKHSANGTMANTKAA